MHKNIHIEPVTRPLADVVRRALTTPSGRPVKGVSAACFAELYDTAVAIDSIYGAPTRRSWGAIRAFEAEVLKSARYLTESGQ